MVRGRWAGAGNRGLALPLAVFGLALAGALVASAFMLGLSDLRSGRAVLAVSEALGRADIDLAVAVNTLRAEDLAMLPVGSTATDAYPAAPTVSVRRLSSHTFLVMASGTALAGQVDRQAGLITRLETPTPIVAQALSTPGPVTLGASVAVLGAPPESALSCRDPARPLGPGIPQVEFVAEAYEQMADWAGAATVTLAQGATVTPNPTMVAGTCAVGDDGNWGDPTGQGAACGSYHPVVHALGDLTVRGGMGQGVLVVDGDLTVEAGFAFRGLLLVGGALRAVRGGASLTGAAQAGAGADLQEGTVIAHSPCAVEESILGFGDLVPLRERAWLTMY